MYNILLTFIWELSVLNTYSDSFTVLRLGAVTLNQVDMVLAYCTPLVEIREGFLKKFSKPGPEGWVGVTEVRLRKGIGSFPGKRIMAWMGPWS